jgi:hypothetical protein
LPWNKIFLMSPPGIQVLLEFVYYFSSTVSLCILPGLGFSLNYE